MEVSVFNGILHLFSSNTKGGKTDKDKHMEFEKLTFGDIMQSGILYFDREHEQACRNICETLRITNLPDIDGEHYHEYSNGEFTKLTISPDHRLAVSQRIFDEGILERFEANGHNVFFVFEGLTLRGIVHMSDYNRNIVLQRIQDDLLRYERMLRQWFRTHELKNQDMLDMFRQKYEKYKEEWAQISVESSKKKDRESSMNIWEGKLIAFDRKKKKIAQDSDFIHFEFRDLLEFAQHITDNSYTLPNNRYINELGDLRNTAMHAKDPVTMSTDRIYSLSDFKNLFRRVNMLRTEHDKLQHLSRVHPTQMRSMELENRFKLEIITNHHPKALNYFLDLD
jgi:hypothetical protein